MAWSAPMTAVAGAIFSSAQFNQYVRDNLNETAPAKATAASQIFVSTGVNAIVARQPSTATVATAQSSSSTSYVDLATVGPQISVATGTIAIVLFSASMANSSSNAATFASVTVSGASSVAASNAWSILLDGNAAANSSRVGVGHVFTGLTAGTNTFKVQYKVGSGTGTWQDREINVIPL